MAFFYGRCCGHAGQRREDDIGELHCEGFARVLGWNIGWTGYVEEIVAR